MKILIADDSADNRHLFESLLQRQGYTTACAINGQDALEKLQTGSFDLVLSDMMMPVMDGFALLRECKAKLSLNNVPFIFITGVYLDRKDEELALKLGAQSLLHKPVEGDELLKAVSNVLSSKTVSVKKDGENRLQHENHISRLIESRVSGKLIEKVNELEAAIKEKEKAIAALNEGEEQFRLLFQTMGQGVIYQDSTGKITSTNPAALTILGLTAEQITGKTAYAPQWRTIHEDGADYLLKEHPSNIALTTGKPVHNAVMGIYNPVERQYRWIKIDAIPLIREGEEKPYQVYTTLSDISDSFLSFKALKENELHLSSIMESTPDAIFTVDRDFKVITANNSARRHYQLATGSELKQGKNMLAPLTSEGRIFWEDMIRAALDGRNKPCIRHYNIDNIPYDVEFTANPIVSASGYIKGFTFFGKDITEKKKDANNLIKYNRLFKMLFLCNQGMVHARNEEELLSDLCQVLVETGNYRMAWVGYALDDENKTVEPVAYAGTDKIFLESLQIHWGEDERSQGPAGKAIRTGCTVICQDILNDPDCRPWHEQAIAQGYAGKVAIPLQDKNRVFAVLAIYATTVNFFTDDEISLLEGLVTDITYGIMALRESQQRQKMESLLEESEQLHRSLFQYNPIAVFMHDLRGRFITANEATEKMTGYSREELLRLRPQDYIAPKDREKAAKYFFESAKGQPQTYEETMIAKDGHHINLSVTNSAVVVNDRTVGIYSVAEDITERRKNENDLKAAIENVNITLEGTIEALALMSELRDPYTAGHQRMVTILALALAEEIGLAEEKIAALRVAGLLHDVGKVYVPAEILSKPGKLSPLEKNLAKAHAEAGYNIIKTIKFPWPVCSIIRQHHERLDGSGYPLGLKGDDIILEARILAVADVVEAMTSHRPYRPALGVDKALEEIINSRGILYDETVVDACVRLFREKGFQFPTSTGTG